MDNPFDKALSHPAALKQEMFALSSWDALRVVMRRQMMMIVYDSGLILGRLVQVWRDWFRYGMTGSGVAGGPWNTSNLLLVVARDHDI